MFITKVESQVPGRKLWPGIHGSERVSQGTLEEVIMMGIMEERFKMILLQIK